MAGGAGRGAAARAHAGAGGHRVVVMEAAVMVRAGWHTSTHQLWAVIIPPEEVSLNSRMLSFLHSN